MHRSDDQSDGAAMAVEKLGTTDVKTMWQSSLAASQEGRPYAHRTPGQATVRRGVVGDDVDVEARRVDGRRNLDM